MGCLLPGRTPKAGPLTCTVYTTGSAGPARSAPDTFSRWRSLQEDKKTGAAVRGWRQQNSRAGALLRSRSNAQEQE